MKLIILLSCLIFGIHSISSQITQNSNLYDNLDLSRREKKIVKKLSKKRTLTKRDSIIFNSIKQKAEAYELELRHEITVKMNNQLDKVFDVLDTISDRYKEEITQDPLSPKSDYLAVLLDIKEEFVIIKDSLNAIDLKNKQNNLEDIAQKFKNSYNSFNQTINIMLNHEKSGISQIHPDSTLFISGHYKLKESAKDILNKYIAKTCDIANKDLQVNKTVVLKITALGYADEQPFIEKYGLFILKVAGKSKKDLPNPHLALDNLKNREYLNELLSGLRANSVGTYLQQELSHTKFTVAKEKNIVGKGEEYPFPNINYNKIDHRRRICRFYITIIKTKQ